MKILWNIVCMIKELKARQFRFGYKDPFHNEGRAWDLYTYNFLTAKFTYDIHVVWNCVSEARSGCHRPVSQGCSALSEQSKRLKVTSLERRIHRDPLPCSLRLIPLSNSLTSLQHRLGHGQMFCPQNACHGWEREWLPFGMDTAHRCLVWQAAHKLVLSPMRLPSWALLCLARLLKIHMAALRQPCSLLHPGHCLCCIDSQVLV